MVTWLQLGLIALFLMSGGSIVFGIVVLMAGAMSDNQRLGSTGCLMVLGGLGGIVAIAIGLVRLISGFGA